MILYTILIACIGVWAGYEIAMLRVARNAEDYRRLEINGRLYKVDYAEPLAERIGLDDDGCF